MKDQPNWDLICDSCFNEDACHYGGCIYMKENFIGTPEHDFQNFCDSYVPKKARFEKFISTWRS